MPIEPRIRAVDWQNDSCLLLDQTKLPSEEVYLPCSDYREVILSIQRLAVRGAPAIGVAGAYAVVLAAREAARVPAAEAFFLQALEQIAEARPTAVNLRWAVARMQRRWESLGAHFSAVLLADLLDEAKAVQQEDIAANRKMAALGASLLPNQSRVMTYCNTGDLATAGIGTAFGVLHQGFLDGKVTHVYSCETRPVLQGLRLTAWELEKNRIPFTVICDNMAGTLMAEGKVGSVIVGADRIAANGDVANKVGTYGLAVLAHHHRIPFFVAAPSSTFDLATGSGRQIQIEQRSAEEILHILGENRHSSTPQTFNPSFDVTPHDLITALICEKGLIESPNEERIRGILA